MNRIDNKRAESSNIALSALLFVVLSLLAALLLLFAFVIWLSELIGSLPLALLLTGASMAIAAYIVYQLSLHPHLKRLRTEYEQFMGFIQLIEQSYDYAKKRIMQLIAWFVTDRNN